MMNATVTDTNGCWAQDSVFILASNPCVWPRDADNNGIVDNNDLLPIGLAYGTIGFSRHPNIRNILWYAHEASDWADTLSSGVNYKHIDCNGNDTVNANDTAAIIQNYGLTHAKTDDQPPWRATDPALYVALSPDTLRAGDTARVLLTLGDANIPASNVYGLAFTLRYDALVVDTAQTKIVFGNSWFGSASDKISIAKDFPLNGELHCSLTRIDHTMRSGSE